MAEKDAATGDLLKPEQTQQSLGVAQDSSTSAARSRSPSPAQTNSAEYKVATQMSRFAILKQLYKDIIELDSARLSLDELEGRIEVLDSTWGVFSADHEQIGVDCRRTIMRHPYVVNKVYEGAFLSYTNSRIHLHKLKSILQERAITDSLRRTNITSDENSSSHWRAKLPEIKLPQFDGEFSSWPSFRDLFISLVINNDQLSKVEKLHYLKTSISGTAAQLIQHSPMSNDSFDTAWQLMTERFNDKERLIMSYLDKVFMNVAPINRTAHDIESLVNSTRQVKDALTALGVPTDHWDYVLIYVVTRRLDSNLREAWEVRRSSLPRPTTFDQLSSFLQARVRALEAVESTSSLSSSQSKGKHNHGQLNRSAHHATTQPAASTQYPCDHCGGTHYIVTCAKFRDLSQEERYKFVMAQKSCFNCLGHHNLAACNSTRTCKTCGKHHHTMIHSAAAASSTGHRTAKTAQSQGQHSSSTHD